MTIAQIIDESVFDAVNAADAADGAIGRDVELSSRQLIVTLAAFNDIGSLYLWSMPKKEQEAPEIRLCPARKNEIDPSLLFLVTVAGSLPLFTEGSTQGDKV